MKKIVAILVCVFAGGVLFAQSADGRRDWREGMALLKARLQQEVTEKTAPEVLQKAQFPTIKMGSREFVIERALHEGYVWTYYYVPAKKPSVYHLNIVFAAPEADADYVVAGYGVSSRMVGPTQWREADFEVSGIEINIYNGSDFETIVNDWKERFGADCVEQHRVSGMQKLGAAISGTAHNTRVSSFDAEARLLHTPTKAYLLSNGDTAVVSVYAESVYGPYKRACSKWGTDMLFDAQPQLLKMNVQDFPKQVYPAQ